MSRLQSTETFLPVGRWALAIRRHVDPQAFDPSRRPLVMVPGYAMNSFILGYHPTGPSMIEHLARAGIEVWTADLRGQGDSRATGRPGRFGLGELALDDLPAVLTHVRAHTASRRAELDVVGCSLGASMVYAYLAHHRERHGLGAFIAIGGPLRWEQTHPLMKLAFASPALAGLVPFKGTRALARRALPVARRYPPLLSIYMNARQIDLSRADQLVNTVDDPVPWINRQVARWVKQGDLVVRGLNTTEALRGLDLPMLVVLANRDGIVPPGTARSIEHIAAPGAVRVLEVGSGEHWYAHADLFISHDAARTVFAPMERWLAEVDRAP